MQFPVSTFAIMLVLLLMFSACQPSLPEDVSIAMAELPEELDYNQHIKPILSDRCFACHGNDEAKQKAGLRLDNQSAYEELAENPGKFAIVPGNLAESQVFHRVVSTDAKIVMPPPESNLSLTAYEKAVLIRWIREGAEYQPHWAFQKPIKKEPQSVKNKEWVKNEIDPYILTVLERKGWQPAPEADRETLLRRVTLDLTGLPPTLEEMDAFLADDAPDAYEKVIDRLLASPHFGERMATDWMDVARYADTHGYTVDRPRDMSPWRDWVIQAFNENQPFADFIKWQIAGDLLPNASREQVLATGFNRNHQQNMEGGIVPEEFRVEYVADRTNTLGAAFLGLTLECARCHDHKYDPISQREYFQLFGFFNNVKEAGQISWDNAMPVPTMLLTNEEVETTLDFIEKQISGREAEVAQLKEATNDGFVNWLKEGRFRDRKLGQQPKGLVARFNLDDARFQNEVNRRQQGMLKQQFVDRIPVNLIEGKRGKGLLLDGDAWLDLGEVGVFDRTMPFSIGLWVKLPEDLSNGVIFHKGDGAALYNFRGYHLALKEGRLELLLAHTEPYNALIKYSETDQIPRNEWIQLTMTYDGSSRAAGLHVYLNGESVPTITDQDKLYKDILFGREKEPGLQIGARWRGIGVKGAVVDDIVVYDRNLSTPEVMALYNPTAARKLFEQSVDELTALQKSGLHEWYLAYKQPAYQQMLARLQKERQLQNQTLDTISEIMVMQEMERPRPTYILERGQYDAHGEEVSPNTPAQVLPMPADLPRNRLGLAEWLIHPDHPLTSRVVANRLWQQFFGHGLVATPEDFGFQGKLPSHPGLLDWLAVDFRESGWDVKKAIRQIVLSATYRQSSKTTREITDADPENTWLARGPSFRLSAEMMRDNALAASDLLVRKIGGKSVKPYQPDGLWRMNGGRYVPDSGENLYRRSLYTFWKRSVPNPTQGTFDAPTRSNCTVERQKTSTPLQSLVLLNDPTFAEAARVIGSAICEVENPSVGIAKSFRLLTGRKPTEGELKVLLELQQTQYEKFKRSPEKARGWLSVGNSKTASELEPALLAANTIVASTIINADATIVKR